MIVVKMIIIPNRIGFHVNIVDVSLFMKIMMVDLLMVLMMMIMIGIIICGFLGLGGVCEGIQTNWPAVS